MNHRVSLMQIETSHLKNEIKNALSALRMDLQSNTV